jgi:hypothetical protein
MGENTLGLGTRPWTLAFQRPPGGSCCTAAAWPADHPAPGNTCGDDEVCIIFLPSFNIIILFFSFSLVLHEPCWVGKVKVLALGDVGADIAREVANPHRLRGRHRRHDGENRLFAVNARQELTVAPLGTKGREEREGGKRGRRRKGRSEWA